MVAQGIGAFARSKGLSAAEGGLRELTPALISGDGDGATAIFAGKLEGLELTLAHHEFASGSRSRRATVAATRIPESASFIPALVCRSRAELERVAVAQLPVERWHPVELEGAAFNSRYRLLVLVGQDPGFVRELFSPTLIAWLTERAPDGLSFELNQGNLVVIVPGRREDAAELEQLLGAAAWLNERIRIEAEEEELDPDLFDEAAELANLERAVAKFDWPQPPASVGEAIAGYRKRAGRSPSVLITTLFWGVVGFAIVAALATLAFNPVAGLIAGVPVGVAAFALAHLVAASRHRWAGISVSRAGLEAFAGGYASSRGLEPVDRWRFHADHRSLPLPGFADHVFFGPIPGSEREGYFAMLADAPELRSRGTEIAYTSERHLAANALIAELERPLSAAELGEIELAEEHRIDAEEGWVVVWRPVEGNLLRTAEGSDRFRERAGKAIAAAAELAARPA